MVITKNRKLIIASVVALILVCAGGMILLDKLLYFDSYKEKIIVAMQQELNRTVRYEKGDFSIRYGPAFTFDKVEIMEKDSAERFLTAKRLTFRIALLPLLEKKVVLKELFLEQPALQLIRYKSGKMNISDLLEGKKGESPLEVSGLRTKKGSVMFVDEMAGEKGTTTSLEHLDLSLNRFVRGKSCSLKISAQVADELKKGSISISGTAKLSPPDAPLFESVLNLKIAAKQLDIGRYWPYYQQYVPFKKITGNLSVNSDFKGKLKSFTARGEMSFGNLRFDYPQVFHAVLTPHDLNFKYDMELTPRDLTVKSLDLFLDGFRVKGSCALRDIPSGDLRITARAATSQFLLENFHQYIPYGVIVKDTADFIEQHIKGGLYRLDEGVLDGRVSQIAHMEKGDNYNALFIRGRVEKGLLTYGQEVPTFNNIQGVLELRGKDFNLHGMSGNFGSSPFTLDGKITDYPIDAPSGYPFTMAMTPKQAEAAWLLDRQKTGKLFLSGPSTLHLTGEGFTSGYNLSGNWDLTRAAFSYPNMIQKPAGRSANLAFKGSIGNEEAKLSSLNLSLAPLNLSASASYRFEGKRRITCEIGTNQFQIGEVAPLVPKLAKYQPSGRIQGAVTGTTRRNDLTSVRWSGSVTFAGASLKPSESISPLTNMNGTVHFGEDSLETSQMTVKLGSSIISGRGMLVGFHNPSYNLDFTSPAIFLSDLGLKAPKREVKISQVEGSISVKDNNLQIRTLSGQVNDSAVSIRGSVTDLRNPKADVTVNAAHLELEDVLALTELERVKKPHGGAPARLAVRASVSADTVRAKGYGFEKLQTVASYEDNILYLKPFSCSAFGGHVTGNGRFDFGSNGIPRHQVTYSAERLSTEQLTRAMGLKKQEITGTMSISGDLTAKGSTAADIKKTALGSARLRIEKGTMRRFAVLSKIFSILNVSQLLKGKLPDMVSGGMPYNRITASLAVQDGIVSSQDFYIDSNAINISAIGRIDMVKEDVDVTIGVQPLQTVDKVVSHIPIVGWILTGKDKALITTYFEAKGKLEDPTVKAIPVKAMTKGVFNIFKRIFQLPAKLFTDTGEVILDR